MNSNPDAAPFVWPLRIYYEDTDASGVVYHANYLRYFERGRTEWLRHHGYSQAILHQSVQVAFTLARIEVWFRRPARLDDELEITVDVSEVRRASLSFHQTLRFKADPERLLAQADALVACVDAETFKPRQLPLELSQLSLVTAAGRLRNPIKNNGKSE